MEIMSKLMPILKSKGALLEILAERSEESRLNREQFMTKNETLKQQLSTAEVNLKEIQNSKIWKMSRPLRRINDMARRKGQ